MIARGLNLLLTGWSGRGLLAVLLAFAIAIPWLVGDRSYVTYLVFTFFVFAVFGHAWNLLAGYCGLLSFGNQVYVGIGGFTLAIIFYYGGINVWLALPISGIVTAAFAFLLATPVRESLVGIGVWKPVAVAGVLWAGYEVALGYFPEADIFGEVYIRRVIILLLIFLGALPLLRLQGAYFAVASWLIAAAVGSIFNEWKVVGAGGGMQIKTDATQIEMYYAGLGLLVFATVVIAWLLKSRYGLALTAVRDDEEAARTVGIDIRKVKLIVFVVAGGLSGLAAGLFYIDAVIITPPSAFTIFWSAYFVFIVVAGGMGTLAGPIIGAAIFVVVDRVLSGFTEYPLLVLGIAAVVIIFVMPRGVMGIINALRHLDDSATGRNELLEALGIGDRLQRALLFARRRDRAPGVVASFLVPGSPCHSSPATIHRGPRSRTVSRTRPLRCVRRSPTSSSSTRLNGSPFSTSRGKPGRAFAASMSMKTGTSLARSPTTSRSTPSSQRRASAPAALSGSRPVAPTMTASRSIRAASSPTASSTRTVPARSSWRRTTSITIGSRP